MVVLAKVCNLSVDDQGAWQDNVSIERVWRDVKPGPLYPKAYDRVRAARADVGEYRAWKNISRRRSPSWETLHLWSLARCPSSIGDGRWAFKQADPLSCNLNFVQKSVRI